ncbi:hypothetical protein MC885_021368 [Smutsia gigantea]|nr:hypothetical protein MC885_021368 [Smutsia gigantea]
MSGLQGGEAPTSE